MLRRDFAKIVGLLAVSQEMAFAQASRVDAPAGAVMIRPWGSPSGRWDESFLLAGPTGRIARRLDIPIRRRRC